MTNEALRELPVFRYHPDPVGTGSLIASSQDCDACGQARGYVYDGPVYAEDDQWTFCPWCIADGNAADMHDAGFTEAQDWGDGIPADVVAEVTRRTPGFSAWQPERWLTHHGDAAAFLGACGIQELRKHGDGAIEAVRRFAAAEGDIAEGPGRDAYLESLDAAGGPTAYLFRCLRCEEFLAYCDDDSDESSG